MTLILIAILVAAVGLTALLCLTLGRSIMRQTKVVAAIVCGFIPPIAIVVLGMAAMFWVGGPSSQALGMLTAMLCFLALPLCLLTSCWVIYCIAERSEGDGTI